MGRWVGRPLRRQCAGSTGRRLWPPAAVTLREAASVACSHLCLTSQHPDDGRISPRGTYILNGCPRWQTLFIPKAVLNRSSGLIERNTWTLMEERVVWGKEIWSMAFISTSYKNNKFGSFAFWPYGLAPNNPIYLSFKCHCFDLVPWLQQWPRVSLYLGQFWSLPVAMAHFFTVPLSISKVSLGNRLYGYSRLLPEIPCF